MGGAARGGSLEQFCPPEVGRWGLPISPSQRSWGGEGVWGGGRGGRRRGLLGGGFFGASRKKAKSYRKSYPGKKPFMDVAPEIPEKKDSLWALPSMKFWSVHRESRYRVPFPEKPFAGARMKLVPKGPENKTPGGGGRNRFGGASGPKKPNLPGREKAVARKPLNNNLGKPRGIILTLPCEEDTRKVPQSVEISPLGPGENS